MSSQSSREEETVCHHVKSLLSTSKRIQKRSRGIGPVITWQERRWKTLRHRTTRTHTHTHGAFQFTTTSQPMLGIDE